MSGKTNYVSVSLSNSQSMNKKWFLDKICECVFQFGDGNETSGKKYVAVFLVIGHCW